MQTTSKLSANLRQDLSSYATICRQLTSAGISMELSRKQVKNINFRLKPNHLSVSAPLRLSDQQIAEAISRRLDWILTQHPKVVAQYAQRQQYANQQLRLWGKVQPFVMGEAERLAWYRQSLTEVMPGLFAKWQPIVGQSADEYRIKKMTTRWGSCNVRARRVWLSVYLPAYPIQCTEYVIVHELCHLHHANHSPAFWRAVQRAMPDYRQWHAKLAGQGQSDNTID